MREGPKAKFIGNLIERWNLYVKNACRLWGVEILFFKMIPEAHFGKDVLDDGDRKWNLREELPKNLKEFFGEELVVTKNTPLTDEETYAKFFALKIKGFWRENPTTLELTSFGLMEKRDLLIGISKDDWDASLNYSGSKRRDISPLPGDLVQLYPLRLHPDWYKKDPEESYYYYYPGEMIYRIKDVLPVPGRLASPPIGFVITADYFREIKKIIVINDIFSNQ